MNGAHQQRLGARLFDLLCWFLDLSDLFEGQSDPVKGRGPPSTQFVDTFAEEDDARQHVEACEDAALLSRNVLVAI